MKRGDWIASRAVEECNHRRGSHLCSLQYAKYRAKRGETCRNALPDSTIVCSEENCPLTRVACFRIRSSGVSWEETPPMELEAINDIQCSEIAAKLANITNREVRWNWEGSPQGHYEQSSYRLRNLIRYER